MSASTLNPYVGAYPWLRGRRAVWGEIARFVARDVPDVDSMIELGAGYCDFVNQFPARRKIAFDLNPEMRAFAAPDVELRLESAIELRGIATASIDLVFASNFLEHLDERELGILLTRIREVLTPRGRLVVIQPNHRLCAERYFDDPTHRTIFDDANIVEWLGRFGLSTLRCVPGLLPFTMNSRLPKSALLTRLYLQLPIRPLAAQMYVVAGRAPTCGVANGSP
jgi:SAM-dependent methyltransferase